MTITAKLKNAIYTEGPMGGRYGGEIYGDVNKRWPDGTWVWTSKVKGVEGNIVTTRNSIYEVELAK